MNKRSKSPRGRVVSSVAAVAFATGKVDRVRDASVLGGKGANLCELARAGIPVPAGVVLTSSYCTEADGRSLRRTLRDALARLEKLSGRKLGGPRPLLLAVRSSPPATVPGLMRAVLNVGMNDAAAAALTEESGDERFACDCHGRFIAGFGEQVHGISRMEFEAAVRPVLEGVSPEPTPDDLRKMIAALRNVLRQRNAGLSDDPVEQAAACVEAAQGRWRHPMVRALRARLGLPAEGGLAVIVQEMAFGNAHGAILGTVRTHEQATGRAHLQGRFADHLQGDDFTAVGDEATRLSDLSAAAKRGIKEVAQRIEAHHHDAVEVDLVIDAAGARVLLSRPMARGPAASLAIAADLVKRGVQSKPEALLRIDAGSLEQLLHPRVDPEAPREVLGHGFAASPGAAAGMIAFDAAEAMRRAQSGQQVILVRPETEAGDVTAMQLCAGIVTSSGGMTSHAAVVARTLGLPCVSGVEGLFIDAERGRLSLGGCDLGTEDWITLDGSAGDVLAGRLPIVEAELSPAFAQVLTWADRHRKLAVRANADTPADAELARAFGAQGIGLCRTEHMFFDPLRIEQVRRMILAKDATERQAALDELLPVQTGDFEKLFEAMDGLPVTIRLLDMPLHEFLPRDAEVLREANPMLGHRGMRLCISHREIPRMQVRAIFEAQARCAARGIAVAPMILLPLVADANEIAHLKPMIEAVAREVSKEFGSKPAYSLGVMIETPRAALLAGELAQHAGFFSFGTNDLTQLTFGFSRDDAGSYLPGYLEKRILACDPFERVDAGGVGELVRLAVHRGRAVKPKLPCGVCGEHGGDPASIRFFHDIGLDSVSCSPYRVPIARLAAAQAELKGRRGS